MSETKWTKGDWVAELSETWRWTVRGGKKFLAWKLDESDAHLIASAPELYKALEEITIAAKSMNDHLLAAGGNPMSEVERRISAADAALAKARGESPEGGRQ